MRTSTAGAVRRDADDLRPADVFDRHREAHDPVVLGDLEEVSVALGDPHGERELADPGYADPRRFEVSVAEGLAAQPLSMPQTIPRVKGEKKEPQNIG